MILDINGVEHEIVVEKEAKVRSLVCYIEGVRLWSRGFADHSFVDVDPVTKKKRDNTDNVRLCILEAFAAEDRAAVEPHLDSLVALIK